jgi:hypothetical protein
VLREKSAHALVTGSSNKSLYVRFEVLTAVIMKSMVFWVVTPRSSERARRFGGKSSGSKSKPSKKPAKADGKLFLRYGGFSPKYTALRLLIDKPQCLSVLNDATNMTGALNCPEQWLLTRDALETYHVLVIQVYRASIFIVHRDIPKQMDVAMRITFLNNPNSRT